MRPRPETASEIAADVCIRASVHQLADNARALVELVAELRLPSLDAPLSREQALLLEARRLLLAVLAE